MSLLENMYGDFGRKKKKIRIPLKFKLIGYGLLALILIVVSFKGQGDTATEDLARAVSDDSGIAAETLSEEDVAEYLESMAFAGTPVDLSDYIDEDLLTDQVPLSDYMTNPDTLKPFGRDGEPQYTDAVLTLQAHEAIHRPYTDAEKYSIYSSYSYAAVPSSFKQAYSPQGREPQTYASVSSAKKAESDPVPTADPTPTPTPEPTPIPTVTVYIPGYGSVTMLEEDYDRASSIIAQGIDDERDVLYDYVIPGSIVCEWLNERYHIPWQALYNCTSMVALVDDDYQADENLTIRKETFDLVADFFSDFYVSYLVDYWGTTSSLGSSVISAENSADVLGNSYVEYMDYNPQPFDSDEQGVVTVYWRSGIKPLVVFNRIEEWALLKSYGPVDLSGVSYDIYSFSENELGHQEVIHDTTSSCLLTYLNNYMFDVNIDLPIFTAYGLDFLPAAAQCLADFDHAYEIIDGIGNSSKAYAYSDLTWITGSTFGERIVLQAINYIGYTYSQGRRFDEGYADCSSLVYRVFKDLGYIISYQGSSTAASECEGMKAKGYVISAFYDETLLQPGDILYWETTNPSMEAYGRYLNIYHTGIFCGFNEDGDGVIIDASSSIGHVVCRTMWGSNKIVAVARIRE